MPRLEIITTGARGQDATVILLDGQKVTGCAGYEIRHRANGGPPEILLRMVPGVPREPAAFFTAENAAVMWTEDPAPPPDLGGPPLAPPGEHT